MPETAPHRRFSFHECLGKGGFGEVYRATMTNPSGLAQVVAVKVLHAKFAPGSPAVSRLRDEGRLMAALQHPNILRVIDLLTLDGRAALIAEYMEGADVNTLVGAGKLPTRVALEIIAAASRGLDGAWNGRSPDTGEPLRLVHRDIKPANIRVGPHGDVKVLDFGIARTDRLEREAETEAHMVLGSLPYLSPEACVSPNLTVKADVYAMGCTLFEVLSGERMTTGKTPAAVYSMLSVKSLHQEHCEARAELLPHDDQLREIVARAVSFRADDRPDAGELADLCEDAAARFSDQPSLARWARSYSWPPQGADTGDLTGSTLNDTMSRSLQSTFELPELPPEPPPETEERSSLAGGTRIGLGLGISVVVGTLAMLLCGGGVLLSGVMTLPGTSPAPVVGTEGSDEPDEVAPVEVVEPSQPLQIGLKPGAQSDEPASQGTGTAGDPAPAPPEPSGASTPTPAPSKPAEPVLDAAKTPSVPPKPIATSPEPVQEPSGTADPVPDRPPLAERAQLKKVVFVKDGTEYQPGNVPPGTYDLMTDFGSGLKSSGVVVVEPGQQVDVACSSRRQTCWVK